MTDKERYKQAFSALPSSHPFDMEVDDMRRIHKKHKKNLAAAAVAFAVIIGGSATAYAADIGGIQEKISIWFFGKQTEASMSPTGTGAYSLIFDTPDGDQETLNYGVASFDEDGGQVWMPADELVSHINETATVIVDKNAKVWVYYYDQQVEITDSFDENGVCNVTLTHEGHPLFVKVIKTSDNSYSYYQTENPDIEPDFATSIIVK